VLSSSLRIARVDVGNYRLLTADFTGLQALHRDLTVIIRRHLPEATASLLALPIASADGTTVDWYSDLAGEALALASLSPARRAVVKDKLRDRLQSLTRLADELPSRVRGSDGLAEALRAATHYPGDEHVYAVGEEPVITLWGFVRSGGRGLLASPVAASQRDRARRRWLLSGTAMLALVAMAAAAWFWAAYGRGQALRTEIAEVLDAGCANTNRLVLVMRRAEQFDPDARKLGDLHAQLGAEQVRCAEAKVVADAIEGAGWDCAAIEDIGLRLQDLDTRRPPLDALLAEVRERSAVCATAQGLAVDLAGMLGDCEAVTALVARGEEHWRSAHAQYGAVLDAASDASGALDSAPDAGTLPPPLARIRERITSELVLCETAARLDQEVVAASADCDLLLRLDGRLAELDTSRAPLLSVRERLDAELALCARAVAFSRDLIDAQMDCARIKELDQRMQSDDMRHPPFLDVRERLDDAVEACRELDALEQSRTDAAGDCSGLAALAQSVGARHAGNPLFIDLRRRIAAETSHCALAERLRAELAAAAGDCMALVALQPRIESATLKAQRLAALRETLTAELGLCRDAEDWRRRLAEAGADCSRLEPLKASLPEAAAGSVQFRDVRDGLAALERRCRSAEPPRAAPAVTAGERVATGKPASTKPAPAQQRCPGSRPVTEAPQLVMVFDASGSMDKPINASAQVLRQLEQLGSGSVGAALGLLGRALETAVAGPTRMQAAKDAGQRIIRGLPGDVDVGLVKIENCPSATDAGFYAPARRGALLSRINALQPRAKTPLASAIARAAGMVDGAKRPALIAVISDGEDTCGGNVCRVAERIAAAKPRLKINVVDITGTGAADCAARVTGGRVLRADNAQSLGAQMQRATAEVAGPAHCRGG